MYATKLFLVAAIAAPTIVTAASSTILGWNNLGMHCMDSDYSVFSVLPPYNTIEGQLIVNGKLVTNGAGYRVTYQAIADPSGSFNSTAMGKGNFYDYAAALYGATLPPERGLLQWAMPGPANTPQEMLFENTNHPAAGVAVGVNWFRAEGIPISPYDDAHRKNPYPLMRMMAWNSANQLIASNDVVLPVSDEMDCRVCHASGTQAAAKPTAGWVWSGLPERDFRLNILRLHDEREFAQHASLYTAALAARGFNPAGLYRGVVADGKPVLCAACHASEALGAPSYGTIPPLTASIHSHHAGVMDPELQISLDNSANRAACYRCHPGSTTRCLRGAMGSAIATDGTMEMQCQSCHGNMSQVGASTRVGWFMEPNCQSCHSGTATHNNGQIRYTSVFTDTNWTVRVAVDNTFATQPNTPAPGLSLFRFSAGHGGLQCEACHGSTHAEFPSSHVNDNLRNIGLQGHAGVMAECTACHTNTPSTGNGGPHGLHPIGQTWVSRHGDSIGASGGLAACQRCHGIDYRGTVLSRAQADRTLRASFDLGSVTLNLARGQMVGCFACHNGPGSESPNLTAAPAVANFSTNTSNDKSVAIALAGGNLTAQILSQPANGAVGVSNGVATYIPNAGFVGTDTFTFSVYDGAKNSAVATGTVSVAQGAYSVSVKTYVPSENPALWPAAFSAVADVVNYGVPASVDWDFGDNSHGTGRYATHTYQLPGNYTWSVVCSVGGQSTSASGVISITAPMILKSQVAGNQVLVTWPATSVDAWLENTRRLTTSGTGWTPVGIAPVLSGGVLGVTMPNQDNNFFILKRAW